MTKELITNNKCYWYALGLLNGLLENGTFTKEQYDHLKKDLMK